MRRPAFIARQSARPEGLVGQVIAAVMQRETEDINRHAIARLDVGPSDRVLDVGTGSGASLAGLAARAHQGLAAGVDHSPVMCRRAARANRALIAAGRVSVDCAASDDLPFPTGYFDAAVSVHTLYFWSPAEPHLREIARVLRRGAQFALVFRPADDPAATSFPSAVYKFRSVPKVETLLASCGFEVVESSSVAAGSSARCVISRRCGTYG